MTQEFLQRNYRISQGHIKGKRTPSDLDIYRKYDNEGFKRDSNQSHMEFNLHPMQGFLESYQELRQTSSIKKNIKHYYYCYYYYYDYFACLYTV